MTYADQSLRRAAVLVSCLDEADARALVGRLPAAPADRLRRAVAALGPVAAPERENVIRAFLLSRQTSADDKSGGVELHEDLARRLSAAEPAADSAYTNSVDSEPADEPFAFLLETESDVVAPFLARESPQTIAVVLSFLAPGQAAELLKRLDGSLRPQVLKRLASLDEIDPASIDVLAAELRTWLERQRQSPSMSGGDKLVRELLATAQGRDRAEVLTELQHAVDWERAGAVSSSDRLTSEAGPQTTRRRNVTFGELIDFADEDLLMLLQAVPQEVVTLGLAGADERLVERILSVLPRKDARRLRRGIHLQAPTRLTDIEHAQRRIETIATKIREEADEELRPLPSSRSVDPLDDQWA
jgi:flagellar motor switch protein FliG